MPDWTKPMSQTYEYYIVDPGTWKDLKKLDTVRSSTISRDSEAETLGSASFVVTDMMKECYIRTYLVTIQNGVTERHPLGTHLIQTPSSKFNGRVKDISLDGYTPLMELKENQPAIGYFVPKSTSDEPVNVMETAYRLTRDHVRAPVIKAECPTETSFVVVADPNDTWLSYLSDFISAQVFEVQYTNKTRITQYTYDLDELGRILFAPVQDIASMQPVWTYTDDNSSILYPDITMDHDMYGIPNVVEVIYSGSVSTGDGKNVDHYYARVENHDPNSPISIPNRGREIVYRVQNPSLSGYPTAAMIREYAVQLIMTLSKLQRTITYTHGYCPVRLNDCVRLNYSRAGLTDVKAKVISQTIKCIPGCPVTEKAVYTEDLLNKDHLKIYPEKEGDS